MYRVTLEAGHGGRDSGAVGKNNRYEKDDNLKMSLAVAERFKAVGINVTLTRDKDITISNNEKCSIEKLSNSNCCIAFHRNSFVNDGANGFEIWLHNKATAKTKAWAREIVDAVRGTGMAIRGDGVKLGTSGNPNANYYFNGGTKSPSMLIEWGFISNSTDNILFDKYFDFYADAVVKATCNYLGVAYEPDNDVEIMASISIDEIVNALRERGIDKITL